MRNKKEGKLNKKELIRQISDGSGLKTKDVAKIIATMPISIAQVLAKNKKVTLSGFGTFSLSKRKSRIGINPRTKEKINIQASVSAHFKPSKKFKERIN